MKNKLKVYYTIVDFYSHIESDSDQMKWAEKIQDPKSIKKVIKLTRAFASKCSIRINIGLTSFYGLSETKLLQGMYQNRFLLPDANLSTLNTVLDIILHQEKKSRLNIPHTIGNSLREAEANMIVQSHNTSTI